MHFNTLYLRAYRRNESNWGRCKLQHWIVSVIDAKKAFKLIMIITYKINVAQWNDATTAASQIFNFRTRAHRDLERKGVCSGIMRETGPRSCIQTNYRAPLALFISHTRKMSRFLCLNLRTKVHRAFLSRAWVKIYLHWLRFPSAKSVSKLPNRTLTKN